MSEHCDAVPNQTKPLPIGPFGAILADPPWSFLSWSGKVGTAHRTANDHYRTMRENDLQNLPVQHSTAPDCALFLWTVDSHLDEAIRLGAAWGFRYKTVAFVWAKTTLKGTHRIGMGYWTRKQTEICLLFTKGAPKRMDCGIRQLIISPRREHSRKPDEQYERIERLVAGPYCELFARQRRPGWAAWGDQLPMESTMPDQEAVTTAP
jgi:N6-adenosine-specific RNA methylase IME4